MEMLEDKIIGQKINSLDSLPHGYEPNLESKWNVIEAGLDEGSKKKVIINWYRMALAAMLLIIGLGSLLLIKTKESSTLQQVNYQTEKQKNKQTTTLPFNSAVEEKHEKKNIKAHHQIQQTFFKPTTKTFLIAENKILNDSSKEIKIIQNSSELNVPSIAVKTKKPRYVEVDFNTQTTFISTHSEPVLASQPIKFKLGTSIESSSSNINEGRNFKLYKSISN